MGNVSVTNTFSGGTKAKASEVNTNFSDLVTFINNRNSASAAWDNFTSVAGITIQAVTNQLILGATRTVTLTAPTPASSSRTVTFPDLSADYSVVGTTGTQTIGGSKTFSSSIGVASGTVSANAIQFNGNVGTGIYLTGTGSLRFASGGTNVFSAVSTGAEISSGVLTNQDGTAGAPSYTFSSHPTTGIYQSTTNRVGISLAGFLTCEFATSGTADDTHYAPQTWFSANGGEMLFDFYSTASVTTAKKIATIPGSAELFLVYGDNGSGATFCDLVMCGGASSTPTVVTSKTTAGSPAVRTYSMAGASQMSVAMASGTYTIRSYGIGVV